MKLPSAYALLVAAPLTWFALGCTITTSERSLQNQQDQTSQLDTALEDVKAVVKKERLVQLEGAPLGTPTPTIKTSDEERLIKLAASRRRLETSLDKESSFERELKGEDALSSSETLMVRRRRGGGRARGRVRGRGDARAAMRAEREAKLEARRLELAAIKEAELAEREAIAEVERIEEEASTEAELAERLAAAQIKLAERIVAAQAERDRRIAAAEAARAKRLAELQQGAVPEIIPEETEIRAASLLQSLEREASQAMSGSSLEGIEKPPERKSTFRRLADLMTGKGWSSKPRNKRKSKAQLKKESELAALEALIEKFSVADAASTVDRPQVKLPPPRRNKVNVPAPDVAKSEPAAFPEQSTQKNTPLAEVSPQPSKTPKVEVAETSDAHRPNQPFQTGSEKMHPSLLDLVDAGSQSDSPQKPALEKTVRFPELDHIEVDQSDSGTEPSQSLLSQTKSSGSLLDILNMSEPKQDSLLGTSGFGLLETDSSPARKPWALGDTEQSSQNSADLPAPFPAKPSHPREAGGSRQEGLLAETERRSLLDELPTWSLNDRPRPSIGTSPAEMHKQPTSDPWLENNQDSMASARPAANSPLERVALSSREAVRRPSIQADDRSPVENVDVPLMVDMPSLVEACGPMPEDVEILVRQLDIPQASIRKEALRDLSQMKQHASSALPAIRILLDDKPIVAAHAAIALWEIDGDDQLAAAELTRLLQSRDPAVVQFTAYALGTMEANALHQAAQIRIQRERHSGATRLYIAEALTKIDAFDVASVDVLTEGLASSNPTQRWLAAIALGNVPARHADRVVPALTASLRDRDPEVRSAAALSLGGFGPAAISAVDDLRDRAALDAPSVREAAQTALACILK